MKGFIPMYYKRFFQLKMLNGRPTLELTKNIRFEKQPSSSLHAKHKQRKANSQLGRFLFYLQVIKWIVSMD